MQTAQRLDIGNFLSVAFIGKASFKAALYKNDELVKTINNTDKVERKILITEAVELGATKTKLAKVFGICRQTIDNYVDVKKRYGIEGLVHSYSPRKSKATEKHRQDTAQERQKGNKVREIEQARKAEQDSASSQLQLPLNEPNVEDEEQPYQQEREWTFTRYAGIFSYLITLVAQYDWLKLLQSLYGPFAKLFMVFCFMAVRNIHSIEQLKNERLDEIASILGLGEKPTRKRIRGWLSQVLSWEQAKHLLNTLFLHQVRAGLVGLWLWFTDNHLLAYSGRERLHKGYSTQRRLMMPGQTNMVTTDQTGRIVDFEIQEGKGDIRQRIFDLANKWGQEVPYGPVMVFDREAYGAEQFSRMDHQGILFVTWEKNTKSHELEALDQERFATEFCQSRKTYRVFEDDKNVSWTAEDGTRYHLSLRRIYIWNVTSNRKTCGLSNVPRDTMSTEECARAILTRWGASENTFKHLGSRHPLHYRPGSLITDDSDHQDVANPEVAEKKKQIARVKKKLNTIYKKLARTQQVLNKNGTPRKNSAWSRLQQDKEAVEAELQALKQERSELPERLDSTEEKSLDRIKKIDTESKNLFDFVTASVWNVRKQMADWLLSIYQNKDEHVDLLYAIAHCQGWIRSDSEQVRVRLEPLEQPSRRSAQEQLCRKLRSLGAKTPNGKRMLIEVGNSPLKG